ncbi:hypothetical protein K435DRAFT_849160 [Dendrothele bispora CBS 962.96]|uniref:EF-hand domain-containing protein n=1 Tax=Dendrothele bispora (strain CBS 962.96) TaxID=1314807 RepID=A0A4S8MTJ2_DENBC|nr:hypothetical protein K435DRAFT_849160 [Dendrothele bispora CBS 962.96]
MPTKIEESTIANARKSSKDTLDKHLSRNLDGVTGKQESKEKSHQRSRKILDALQDGVKYAAIIADANGIAKVVVGVFAAVLEREAKRRKNDEEIVVVYHILASAMFTIRHIEKQKVIGESINQELESHFDAMQALITKFGNLAEKYYTKLKLAVVRFFKAEEIKAEIEDITKESQAIEARIMGLLQLHTAVVVGETNEEIKFVASDVESILKIVSRLADSHTEKEKNARKLVDSAGGIKAVLQDDEKIKEVAKVFKDYVSADTTRIVREDLNEMLQESLVEFDKKVKEGNSEILLNLLDTRTAIMDKLNSGPHNLIEDEEFKLVWETEHGWKTSVKSKLFVDELCGYFRSEFQKHLNDKGEKRRDNWTLDILTRVMFHPAIADAIDDDGSGYISAHEFNTFLREKPSNWTTPEWFAFVSSNISRLVKETTEKLRDKSDNEVLKEPLGCYLQHLCLIEELVKWDKVTGYSADFPDDLEYDDAELERLINEFNEANSVIFGEILEHSHGNIKEYTDIDSLQQKFDKRIEVWFLPFLLEVLKRQNVMVIGESVEDDSESKSVPRVADDKWEEMDTTLTVLLYEFHARMKQLLRGWRVQKLDTELQVKSFSGGVFAGWCQALMDDSKKKFQLGIEMLDDYYASSEDESEIDSEEEGEGSENGDRDESRDSKATSPEIMELRSSMSEMQKSLSELQNSVAELTTMMKSMQLSLNKGNPTKDTMNTLVQNDEDWALFGDGMIDRRLRFNGNVSIRDLDLLPTPSNQKEERCGVHVHSRSLLPTKALSTHKSSFSRQLAIVTILNAMVPPPSMISRRARRSHWASVIDVPDEAEPVAQLSTPNAMPLDGLRSMAQTTASSLSRHRRSPSPIASRVGIEGASVSTPTPTGTSITAHNANILRTVSTNTNSSNASVTQNNLQFIETLQMFNNSSHNTFTDTTFTSPARDSNSYLFYGPATFTVHPDFINQVMLRTSTHPTGLRGLDSTPSVSISDPQVPVGPRSWVDADALERGGGPVEAPALMGTNQNRRFINGNVFRAPDTNNW